MGDINLEYWQSVSKHHQDCSEMNDMLLEHIISGGYVQLIRDVTRVQGASQSCLDHIYTRSPQYIFHDSICNKNIVGYDHNYISCHVSLQSPAFTQRVIEVRALKNLKKEEFKELHPSQKFMTTASWFFSESGGAWSGGPAHMIDSFRSPTREARGRHSGAAW